METTKVFSTAYKFRLKPTKEQENLFAQWAGCCRYIYNYGLGLRKQAYENEKKSVSYVDTANLLTKLKKEEGTIWLASPPAQVLQQSLKDLDQAYQNFFKRVKKGKIGEAKGFPQFKKKNRSIDSFRFPQPSQFSIRIINKKRAKLKLPKIGEVEFVMSRAIEGRVRNCTLSRDGKEWYVSFNCEIALPVAENNGPAVGIDRGVVHTITISDERYIDLPCKKIKELEKRKAKLQRKKRKQIKFSSNWRKTQIRLGGIDKKIRRIRHDWIHKTTTDLAKNHGLIVLEDLQIKNMTKSASGTIEEPGKNVAQKSGLNRSILRQSWGKFETLLKYKCERLGSRLVLVPPHYTSKDCSFCGEEERTERPTQAMFHCIACGLTINADLNASLNILTRGQRGSACGGDRVARPVEAGTALDETTRKRKSLKESPTIAALAV